LRRVRRIDVFLAAAGPEHDRVLREELGGELHRGGDHAAGVATEVQDEPTRPPASELPDGVVHLGGRLLTEFLETDVTRLRVGETHDRDGRYLDELPLQRDRKRIGLETGA